MKKRRKESKGEGMRLLHIRVSQEVHRMLRVLAAEQDTSMQEVVEQMIEKQLLRKKEG